MDTTDRERVVKGMHLLTVGKWSLKQSRLPAIAAMINARPDVDTLVLEVRWLWMLLLLLAHIDLL